MAERKAFSGYILLLLMFLALPCIPVHAQERQIPVRDPDGGQKTAVLPPIHHKVDLGAGIGLDYGGIMGLQLGYSPIPHLMLLASGGYYLIQFGWQAGLRGLYPANDTHHAIRPFVQVLYGYNALILVNGYEEYDRAYRGVTPGAGVQFRFGKGKRNGIDIALDVPIKSEDWRRDFDHLKNDPRLEALKEQSPVTISIGYHHEF